ASLKCPCAYSLFALSKSVCAKDEAATKVQITGQQRPTRSLRPFIRANLQAIPARRGEFPEKSAPNRCGCRCIAIRRFVRTIASIVRANRRLVQTCPPLSLHRWCLDRCYPPMQPLHEQPWKPPRNIPVATHHYGATCASIQQLRSAARRYAVPRGCRFWSVASSIRQVQVKPAAESTAPSRKLDVR